VVGVENISAIAGDEVGNSADQPLAIRAFYQQRGRSNGSLLPAGLAGTCNHSNTGLALMKIIVKFLNGSPRLSEQSSASYSDSYYDISSDI
jgi:hypothetical protein